MTTKTKPKTSPPPDAADIPIEVVGEWTERHTMVVAQLLIDLEDSEMNQER